MTIKCQRLPLYLQLLNKTNMSANVHEIWRPIKDYEGFYEVSNLGRLKSLERTDCKGQHRKERILKQGLDTDGYTLIILSKDRVRSTKKPHRLAAQAFIPNPHNLPQINHIDGVKTNNHVTNLEWCDTSHNIKHALRVGLHPEIAETHKWATLSNTQVLRIFNDPRRNVDIAREMCINPLIVGRIKSGYKWSSITGKIYEKRKFK